jgi:MGT family glycosyltransferase
MARIVFLNFPAQGHTNPTLPMVKELVARGETVVYYSFNEFRASIEATGAEFRSCDQPLSIDPHHPDPNMFRFGVQLLQTAQMLVPQLLPRVEADKPDVIIHDSLCSWGLIIARFLKIPAICSTTTFAVNSRIAAQSVMDVVRFLGMIVTTLPEQLAFERIKREMRTAYGTAPKAVMDMYRNESDMTLVYTSSKFQPFAAMFPSKYHFTGASIDESLAEPHALAPLNLPSGKRIIYVSLGTLFNDNMPFFKLCFDAFSSINAHVVLSVGKKNAIEDFGTIPANMSVHSFVPQLALLRQCDLFITHGGMNSVHEALWFGVPMIVVPQASDQLFVARQVEAVGAGMRIENNHVTVGRLRSAAEKLLASPSARAASAQMGQSLKASGGFRTAADEVQAFVRRNGGK